MYRIDIMFTVSTEDFTEAVRIVENNITNSIQITKTSPIQDWEITFAAKLEEKGDK